MYKCAYSFMLYILCFMFLRPTQLSNIACIHISTHMWNEIPFPNRYQYIYK